MFKIFISIFVMSCFALGASASGPSDVVEPIASQDADLSSEWGKSTPITFSFDYTIVSDYIFRGLNFSEYPGEGREKLNHQLGVGLELFI